MKYDLATLARRARNVRRRSITLRDIQPPAIFASNLFARCYRPVVALWANALPRIMLSYERTLSSMTTDAPADVQAAIDGTADDFLRLLIELIPELRDWIVRQEAWSRDRWRAAVLSATSVDLGTVLGPEDMRATLETYLEWNTSLIRDVSDQTRKRIEAAVYSGLTTRAPAAQVAKQIREATGLARDRSLRVASDQLAKVTGALADERRREAGIDVWRWRWSHKKNGRAEHIARDGGLYTDNPALVGKSVDGKVIRAAPPENDRPSRPPYCGCRSQSEIIFAFD